MSLLVDIKSYMDFEADFEAAAVAWLLDNDGPAVKQRDALDIATPRIAVRFDVEGSLERFAEVNDALIHNLWTGQFSFKIYTNRQTTNASHGVLRGLVRGFLSEWQTNFTATLLPRQRVCHVREGSSTQSPSGENVDETEILFAVHFMMRLPCYLGAARNNLGILAVESATLNELRFPYSAAFVPKRGVSPAYSFFYPETGEALTVGPFCDNVEFFDVYGEPGGIIDADDIFTFDGVPRTFNDNDVRTNRIYWWLAEGDTVRINIRDQFGANIGSNAADGIIGIRLSDVTAPVLPATALSMDTYGGNIYFPAVRPAGADGFVLQRSDDGGTTWADNGVPFCRFGVSGSFTSSAGKWRCAGVNQYGRGPYGAVLTTT